MTANEFRELVRGAVAGDHDAGADIAALHAACQSEQHH